MKIKTMVLIIVSIGLLYAQQIRDTIILYIHVPSISSQAPTPNLPVFTGILKGDPGYVDSQANAYSQATYQTNPWPVWYNGHYRPYVVFSFPHTQTGKPYVWRGCVSIKPLNGYKITPDSIFESIESPTNNIPVILKENYTAELIVSTHTQPHYNFLIIRSTDLNSKQYDLMGRLKNYSSGVYIKNEKSFLIIHR